MLLTPPEAAERLRVSLRMVYSLMADGSITAVRRYAHLYPEVQASALASIFRRKA